MTATQAAERPRASGGKLRGNDLGWSKMRVGLGAGAVVLAGAAIFNASRAKRTELENPRRGDVIRVDGVDVHYVDSGTPGPVVVLLHGNGTTLEDWFACNIYQELSKANRVIAFDRPGFGYSTRPRARIWSPAAQADLLALALRSLGADQATVVGHSFATMVTIALALQHPELVKSVVLISGYYYPSARADVLLAAIPALPIIGDVDRYSLGPLSGLALRPMIEAKLFAPANVASSWKRFPFAMTLRPSQLRAEGAEAALMIPSAAKMSSVYEKLTIPVTIVSGEGDRILDHANESERLAAELPAATLTTLSGVGHMVQHTATELVIRAIQQNIEGTSNNR